MSALSWAVPTYPKPDRDAVDDESAHTLVLSRPAVTRHGTGPLPTVARSPKRFISGAVYTSAGELVTASQRIGGFGGDQYVSADLPRIPPRLPVSPLDRFGGGTPSTMLDGLWAYGGHWMDHFGHFITETLTSVPTDHVTDEEVRGLVMHPTLPTRHGTPDVWRDRLAELAGLPVARHIVGGVDCFPERLVVSRRRLSLNAFARPGATVLWDRVTRAVVPDPRPEDRVFFSRRRFEADMAAADPEGRNNRSALAWDLDALEASFERAGFTIVHPETMSIDEQIRTVANAAVIAGGSGTALHLAAFATAATRVLELGDIRSGANPVPNQRVVCRARGQEMAYIAAAPDSELSQDERLDRAFADLF
ncbi:glycosyltransferase family 61 protein [Labedella phragmitis]|nr:glycosyltransferase 61 family protein [Labedella phragmitis]